MTDRVACLGGSITRAQISVDYLEPLARRHGDGAPVLSRFGVNGEFAHNLLQRRGPPFAASRSYVVRLRFASVPDAVLELLGSHRAEAMSAGTEVGRPSAPAPKPPLTWSGDLNSRPLRPEACATEPERPSADPTAGDGPVADRGERSRRPPLAKYQSA